MDTEMKSLLDSFNAANTELKNMKEKHDAELKALSEKSGEAAAESKAAVDELKSALEAQAEKQQKAMDDLVAQMKRPGSQGMGGESKSLGHAFISEAKQFIESDTLLGKSIQIKDISGVAGSGGALVRPDRDPTVYRSIGGMRQLRIADLIPSIPTASNAVEIMRLADAGGPAAPQGPAETGIGGGELAEKTKVDMEWELVTVKIPTIAVHTRASRQVLSDAPMMQSMIDGELTYKLQLESDDQLLNGDGTGQNLTGLLVDSSVNSVGEIATGTTADELPAAMIDHIRAAVTECQINEYYNINGLVLNPVDWQTLETAKATDGHYLLVAFAATSPETPSVWRIPVIVTNAMPESSFLLGDWNLGAQLYRREGVGVRVSESHNDNFTKNAVQILAEERYGLGISRPKAYCKGLFTVAEE
jgi:HK97 family phage major capsid protein